MIKLNSSALQFTQPLDYKQTSEFGWVHLVADVDLLKNKSNFRITTASGKELFSGSSIAQAIHTYNLMQ